MKVVVLLADSAQVDPAHKLHTLGLGWTVADAVSAPHAMVALVELESDETEHVFEVQGQLMHSQTREIVTGASGDPIEFAGQLQVGTYAAANIVPTRVPIALSVGGGLRYRAGEIYQWEVTVTGADGERVSASALFYVRQPTDPSVSGSTPYLGS